MPITAARGIVSEVKRLVLIPVIHTLADLGSLAGSVRAQYLDRVGPAGWAQRQQAVQRLWHDIGQAVDALQLDYPRVRIYQDGLPVCGKEEDIVRELAGAGSTNHQLLLELAGKGAVVMGTEDPQLLLREYQLQRGRAGAAGAEAVVPPGEAAAVLAGRDRFIARRIEATLQDGETGLLFFGTAHRLDGLVASGIAVETLPL